MSYLVKYKGKVTLSTNRSINERFLCGLAHGIFLAWFFIEQGERRQLGLRH